MLDTNNNQNVDPKESDLQIREYEHRRKKKIICIITTIVAAIIISTSIVIGILWKKGIFTSSKPQLFSDHGVTVVLPEQFKEIEGSGFAGVYESNNMIFTIDKYDKTEIVPDAAKSLESLFMNYIVKYNNPDAETYKELTETGKEFYYFHISLHNKIINKCITAAYEGNQYYYIISFGCDETYFIENQEAIIQLIKSVTVQ